ncbi:uncharacterized protein LOC132893504 [Neoarius graeffei]|uniref:uncharacterized protein LOC132893504 n=1 Tax=Neoarius graeffei TaxID=443677 RepID=UPI00298C4C37|nr:uncharacterized protein LOC132893504 [Neoarius graeffei]
MLGKFVIAYIYNILIYSPDEEIHHEHVRSVLSCLLQNLHLHVKAEKCEFHVNQISFLEYIINSEGMSMDQVKVLAITSWPTPMSVKELQCFLGFTNFYQRFIQGFSIIAAPLTLLLKNGPRHLQWNPAAEEAFNQLKAAFMSAPILQHPDPTTSTYCRG